MATISPHHVLASLQGCHLDDRGNRRLLTRAGINPEHLLQNNSRIHTDQVARLFRLVQQELNDEFMGFTAQGCKFGAFALMVDLVQHCKTLGAALRKGIEFYNLFSDDLQFSLERNNQHAEFSFKLANPALDPQFFLTEFLLVIWHRFPSWYIGEAIRLKETHFVHSPPEHLHELQIMFPGRLQFNQTANRLIFDADFLSRRLHRSGRELCAFVASNPADIMTIPGADNSLEARIEHLILHNSSDKLVFPKAEKLAEQLQLNSLTLYRHLQKEGTSYQHIKDNIRRERAIDLLTRQKLSVETVSDIIGFSEPRSFTRAFRQWTGLSPRNYCKLHRN